MSKELIDILDSRMKQHAASALQGFPCVLGTMTTGGVILDNLKHEIKDPLFSDWELEIELPVASRVIKTAAPVSSDGSDISGSTKYSELCRLDFHISGFDSSTTHNVHLNLKAGLKTGDRVLCIPVNGGQDCVIISKVVS